MRDENTIWDDLAAAEEAVSSGDFRHALQHIGPVLLEEPESADALRLLMRVAAEHPGDPLELVDVKDEAYAGTVAVAAMLCARAGQADRAIAYLVQIVQAVPQSRLFVWLQQWSRDPAFLRAMSAGASAGAILTFIVNGAEGEHREARLRELLDAVENLRLHAPEHDRLAYAHLLLLRRLERPDDALAAAAEVLEKSTELQCVVGLATGYREANRPRESLAAFERAARIDPENAAIQLDLGDGHIELQQFDEAIDAYERALELEPDQPWAVASIEYARFRLSNDAEHLDELDDLAAGGNERALTLAVGLSPFLGFLPEPHEATINLLAQLDEQNLSPRRGESFQFSLSAIEAPSSRLAFDRWAEGKGFGQPHVTIGEVPRPDPRKAWDDVQYALWQWDGVNPRPAVEPPRSPELVSSVASLAAMPFYAYSWFAHAQTLTLPSHGIDDLLACMVHPPEADPRWRPWEWMQRAQFASAMLIAASEPRVAWRDSRRRAALHALVHGPIDWTTSAAIVALTIASAAGVADEREAMSWLQALWSRAPDSGYWTVETPLTFALLRFPNLDPDVREALRQTRAEFFFEETPEDVAPPEPEKKKGFWRRLFGG